MGKHMEFVFYLSGNWFMLIASVLYLVELLRVVSFLLVIRCPL